MCLFNMEEYKFCQTLGLHMNYTLCLVFSSKLASQKTVLLSFIFHFHLQEVEKAAGHQATALKKWSAEKRASGNTMQENELKGHVLISNHL